MEPLPDEPPQPRGPPLAEKLVVGCGLFILLVVLFIAAMAIAVQRACSCATHVVAQQAHVVHVAGNLDVTLLSHGFSAGTPLAQPRQGLEFLITDWKIRNPARTPRRVSAFTAVSGIHVVGPERNVLSERNPLPRGVIDPGQAVVGRLVFEVEKHATIAEINYRWGSFQATWQFPR
jgi:hypothetical protein